MSNSPWDRMYTVTLTEHERNVILRSMDTAQASIHHKLLTAKAVKREDLKND